MADFRAMSRDQRLSETSSHQIFARAAAVAEHHHDSENPDKPLWLMVPCGLVAFAALLGVLWDGYQLWVATPRADPDIAIPQLLVALVIYFGSLFGFSYGYELYDVKKAVRLTIIIGLIGLAAIFILLALGAVLKGSSGSKSKSSSSSSGSGSSFGGGSSYSGGPNFSLNLGSSYGSYGRSYGNQPLGAVLGSLVHPGECSVCARPLPPGGKATIPAGLDPSRVCPKCGQEFEAAGENARAAGRG